MYQTKRDYTQRAVAHITFIEKDLAFSQIFFILEFIINFNG